MKIQMSVALEDGDSPDFSVELADGTVLTPDNNVVHLAPEKFLKSIDEKEDEAARAVGRA